MMKREELTDLILDINFLGKTVVIVGGGAEAYRKTLSFLDANSKVLVVSNDFLDNIHVLHQLGKIDLVEKDIVDADTFVNGFSTKPDVLVAVTNNPDLNSQLGKYAKAMGCMVHIKDNPTVSDFMFPASAKIADVKIALFTGRKSPSMARVLRNRIEKMINEEDLLQIQLQEYIRPILKQQISE